MKSFKLIVSNPQYFGAAWAFASINILFGTWAIYIPRVKENLAINNAELGLAIFCLSIGVFVVFPFASTIINKLGVGKATFIGVFLSCFGAILPIAAPNFYMLMAGLFIFGAANGFTDISMNTLVTELEKKDNSIFMSASHGFFSLGGVLAGLGSFLIGPLVNPVAHICVAVILVLVVHIIFYKNYIQIKSPVEDAVPLNLKLLKPLFLLGIIAFISMGSEGAIIDWSGLYLKDVIKAPETLWGVGFLGFQITMTTGRFIGDGLSSKIGSVRMISFGAVLAILGYCMVLSEITYLAIAGFAICGLGFSVMVPEVFRTGSRVKGVNSAHAVSFMAGTGYAGFLCAPPILGFIAERYALPAAFVTLLIGITLVLGVTFLLKRKR